MHTRRKRYRLPAGAILFVLCLFGLVAIFVNDWIVTHTSPVIAEATSNTQVEPPAAPADPMPAPKEGVQPPAEPPVKVEDPDPLPAPKAPEEDPWASEKERLQKRPRGRNGVVVQVNPRILLNGNAFAFGGPGVFQHQFAVPGFRPLAPPRMIDPEAFAEEFLADVATRRAAIAAQALIFASMPEARHFISSFGIARKDRRLVVNVRPAFMQFDDAQRRTVMDGIAAVWRESIQLRQHGCSKTVEFHSNAGWNETLEP